jgi:hypothetical protein
LLIGGATTHPKKSIHFLSSSLSLMSAPATPAHPLRAAKQAASDLLMGAFRILCIRENSRNHDELDTFLSEVLWEKTSIFSSTTSGTDFFLTGSMFTSASFYQDAMTGLTTTRELIGLYNNNRDNFDLDISFLYKKNQDCLFRSPVERTMLPGARDRDIAPAAPMPPVRHAYNSSSPHGPRRSLYPAPYSAAHMAISYMLMLPNIFKIRGAKVNAMCEMATDINSELLLLKANAIHPTVPTVQKIPPKRAFVSLPEDTDSEVDEVTDGLATRNKTQVLSRGQAPVWRRSSGDAPLDASPVS